jgi:hypothetical protein
MMDDIEEAINTDPFIDTEVSICIDMYMDRYIYNYYMLAY